MLEAVALGWQEDGMSEECSTRKLPVWADAFNDEMIDYWSGEVLWNQPMANFTTFRVGGSAEAIIFPAGIKELGQLLKGIKRVNIPCRLIGGGSNILVADEGLCGVTLVLGKSFSRINVLKEVDDRVYVKVEAGCSLGRLVNWSMEQGLSGLEFVAGIPGTVGGALVMNAGAWGSEICQVVSSVTVMDENGDCAVKDLEELHYTYRSWGEEAGSLAVEGVFQLQRADKVAIKKTCQKLIANRKGRQPTGASCGSFFKNPKQGKTAGQLIDEAGLKGKRVGGAMVSPVHGNFLINTGTANAHDLVELMKMVQSTVKEKFSVFLEPEVKLLGFEGRNL
ncbi:MAG: UDP-N-acetylmuramate dehydrogenase [Thermodesulfobacteriota bacterium]